MLLFWPIGLYALVRYWKEDEDGVRTPLLASFAVLALWLGFIGWGLTYRPPASAQMAEEGEEEEAPADDGGIGAQVRRSVALANLPSSTGRVDFPAAHASIDVPAHFRFIDRDTLVKAFAGTEDEPGEQSIGWLVHERVDLTAKDAWHVDVDRLAEGFISDDTFASQSRETLLAAAKQATRALSDQQDAGDPSYSLVGYPELPRLDPVGHSVAWVAEIAYDGKPQHVLDCMTACASFWPAAKSGANFGSQTSSLSPCRMRQRASTVSRLSNTQVGGRFCQCAVRPPVPGQNGLWISRSGQKPRLMPPPKRWPASAASAV